MVLLDEKLHLGDVIGLTGVDFTELYLLDDVSVSLGEIDGDVIGDTIGDTLTDSLFFDFFFKQRLCGNFESDILKLVE